MTAAIAATRFGLGARPGELDTIARTGPEPWLLDQLQPDTARLFPAGGLKDAATHLKTLFDYFGGGRRGEPATPDPEEAAAFRRTAGGVLRAEIGARMRHGALTPAPFHERLTRFWANHFSVSTRSLQTLLIAGAFEREAIRPHVLGRFQDLAEAAVFHQGLLVYLDNWQSIGPGSRAGRRSGRGLNENLAREVLELHTVTPEAGYTQDDVTEFARALTGWTVGNRRLGRDQLGEVAFVDLLHEPGRRRVLGQSYGETGGEQARAILRDLCARPETARNVATKLARHMLADEPPLDLVQTLTARFLETGGDLMALYRALVSHPEAWGPEAEKVKTPDELVTSTARLLGLQQALAGDPGDVLESLAQRPFNAPSPEGWPDTAEAWIGPDSLTKRIEWANRVASRAPDLDARELLRLALGPRAGEDTLQAVARAESGAQALALALMSPDFQRR